MESGFKDFINVFHMSLRYKNETINPQQLFIYSFLYRNRIKYSKDLWLINTTVNNINSLIDCKIKGVRAEKKVAILQDLFILKGKGLIHFDQVDYCLIKDNDILTITFPMKYVESNPMTHFVMIRYEIFDLFTDKNKYWVYCYIASYQNYGRRISYPDLSKISGISVSTLEKKTIKEMNSLNSRPRIYKFSGSYGINIDGDKIIQEKNTYFIELNELVDKEFSLEKYNKLYDENGETRSKPTKKKKLKDTDTIWTPGYEYSTVVDFQEIINEETSWGKERSEYEIQGYIAYEYEKIDYYDYSVYRTSIDYNIDPKFNKRVKKAIETMRQPYLAPKYDYCKWEEWEEKYSNDVKTYLDSI